MLPQGPRHPAPGRPLPCSRPQLPTLASGPGGGSGGSARANSGFRPLGNGGPTWGGSGGGWGSGGPGSGVLEASGGVGKGEGSGEAEAGGDAGPGGAGGTGGSAFSGGLSTRVTTNTLWPQPGLDTEMRCSAGEEGQPGGLLSPGPGESVGGTRAGQGASALSPSASSPSSPSESESESESGPGLGPGAPFSCPSAAGSSRGSSSGWGPVTVISGMEADSCSRCSFSSRSRASTKLRLQPFWISASSAFCVSMKLFTCGRRSRPGSGSEWPASSGSPARPPPAVREEPAHRLLLGLTVEVQAQQGMVHLEGQRQRHEPARLDLVLPKVQSQEAGALGDELCHCHRAWEGDRRGWPRAHTRWPPPRPAPPSPAPYPRT